MKPISLHGHERSITQIRYNREGDLLFSAAKDQYPNVWYSINGERLGESRKRDLEDVLRTVDSVSSFTCSTFVLNLGVSTVVHVTYVLKKKITKGIFFSILAAENTICDATK